MKLFHDNVPNSGTFQFYCRVILRSQLIFGNFLNELTAECFLRGYSYGSWWFENLSAIEKLVWSVVGWALFYTIVLLIPFLHLCEKNSKVLKWGLGVFDCKPFSIWNTIPKKNFGSDKFQRRDDSKKTTIWTPKLFKYGRVKKSSVKFNTYFDRGIPK